MKDHRISEKEPLVGISGTVVDFGIFNLLTVLFHFPTILSSMISFLGGLTNNFFWNRKWTYPESRELPVSEQFGKFGIVSVAGLAIRTVIFSLIEKPMIGISTSVFSNLSIPPEIIGHNMALATVVVIVLFWNYFANKFWTYRKIVERKN
jgi:putative flippase GtrA